MRDDEHSPHRNEPGRENLNREQRQGKHNRQGAELPASVIFMEMMRQAAQTAHESQTAADAAPQDNAALATPAPPAYDALPHPDAAPSHTPDEHLETAGSAGNVDAAAETASLPQVVPVSERPPLTEEERRHAAALEAQRLRRVKRRQEKRRQTRVSVLGGVIRTFLVIVPSALLMATILSWWTDPTFLQPEVRSQLGAAMAAGAFTPTPTVLVPTPNYLQRIGIVSGHNGPTREGLPLDPGAVCTDSSGAVIATEREINFNVATRVVTGLRELGYSVDLLDEFDPRLQNYQAEALVSIHANTCQDFGERVSGYLIAKAEARPEGGIDTLLAECVAQYYGFRTQLDRHFGVTEDMTDYHSFREVHPTTPAAIIELGFMLADQELLLEQSDLMAQGIVEGIRCFLEPDFNIMPSPAAPTLTPTFDLMRATATPS